MKPTLPPVSPVRPNRLRRILSRGETAWGPNLQIPSPELVEIIGLSGFDYVMLDAEHGAAFTRLSELLLACDAIGITGIVRVPSHDRSVLLPPLEMGAGGLQVPFVETAEQARALVFETKYPPLGGRGLSGITRAARFGFVDQTGYRRAANRETLLFVQIESLLGMENVREIAAVAGVDGIFIGPADLAQSLGQPMDRMTAATERAIRRIIRDVGSLKPVGISAFNRKQVRQWHKAGVKFFLTSSVLPLRTAFLGLRTELLAGLPRVPSSPSQQTQ